MNTGRQRRWSCTARRADPADGRHRARRHRHRGARHPDCRGRRGGLRRIARSDVKHRRHERGPCGELGAWVASMIAAIIQTGAEIERDGRPVSPAPGRMAPPGHPGAGRAGSTDRLADARRHHPSSTSPTRRRPPRTSQMPEARTSMPSCTSKFTNKELYDWMVGQIEQTYFQAYQLAYTMAKAAERCYPPGARRIDDSDIHPVRLLGQPAQGPHRRREAALRPAPPGVRVLHPERPRARDRQAGVAAPARSLRAGGAARERHVPDRPAGDPVRPRQSRALHAPAQDRGADVPVRCRALHQRVGDVHAAEQPDPHIHRPGGGYPRTSSDARFTDDPAARARSSPAAAATTAACSSCASRTSVTCRSRTPGAISTWRLTLNNVYPQFDYSTISDVVLHLRYTARDGERRSPPRRSVGTAATEQRRARGKPQGPVPALQRPA